MKTYSNLEKTLHRQFLSNNSLTKFLFDRLFSKSKIFNTELADNHIFITGLARSGTTALLNRLYSSNELSSFLYKFMPFILSPTIANFYSNLNGQKKPLSKDRFHNDGIKISIDSPECLDEIFWIKTNEKIKISHNKDNIYSKEVLDTYIYLINFLRQFKIKRMIIKNNNNHTRIEYLSNHFKKAYFLLMYRNPISHARSLLSQHLNFIHKQTEEPFILEYMNLIGHNEFGKNVVPFIYPTDKKDNWHKIIPKNTLDYWRVQWINTYRWILKSNVLDKDNIYLVCMKNYVKMILYIFLSAER